MFVLILQIGRETVGLTLSLFYADKPLEREEGREVGREGEETEEGRKEDEISRLCLFFIKPQK